MNKRILFLTLLLPLQVQAASVEPPRTTAIGEITLERFNMDRVIDARNHYKGRMRNVQYTLWAILGGIGAVTVAGGIAAHVYSKPTIEQGQLQSLERRLGAVNAAQVYAPPPETPGVQPPMTPQQFQALTQQVQALSSAQRARGNTSNDSGLLSGGWSSPLKFGFMLGIAGVVMTIGTQVLHVVAGTLEELISLWVNGYKYWYKALEQEVRTTFGELNDALVQARKIANSGFEGGTLKGPGRRYSSQTRAMGKHYRSDIATMYQTGLSKLERLVALMYLMSSHENQAAINRHVSSLAKLIEQLRDSLQYDLNENTHGTLTHYSNRTMDLFREFNESNQIFLSNFREFFAK